MINLLEAAVVAVMVLFAIAGFRKGFVKKFAAMVSLALSIVLVSALLPYITQYLKENTPVYTFLVEQCTGIMEKQVLNSLTGSGSGAGTNSGSAADAYANMGRDEIRALLEQNGFDSTMLDQLSDEQLEVYKNQYIQQYLNQYLSGSSDGSQDSQGGTKSLTRIEQTQIIENLPLPEQLKDILLDYNNDEGYKGLGVSSFPDYLINFVATSILNVVAYLVSIVVVQLLLWGIITLLNLMAHIPVIRVINRFAGMLLGLVQALLLLWVFFLILSLCSATSIGTQLIGLVEQSTFLSWMYDSNLFLQVALRAGSIFM